VNSWIHLAFQPTITTTNLVVNIKAYKQNTIIIISKQQNDTNYAPVANFISKKCSLCNIRLLQRYLVLMTVPPLLIPGPDDPYGVVKAG